jgi:acyl-CoA synthetase (AMP-forming)/AMP-acid ligase II
LQRAAGGLSTSLVDSGLELGDRVVVYLPNSVETVVSIFGVSAAGGCLVVLDPSTPAKRLEHLVEHSGAQTLIAPVERAEIARRTIAASSGRPNLLLVGDESGSERARSFAAAAEATPSPPRPVSADQRAAIIYTSGSTGEPKGVTLSHGNIDAVTASVRSYLGHKPSDVLLSTLQLAFGYGLLQLLVSVLSGSRLVLRQGFGFAYDIVNTISEEEVTGFAGVPTTFAMLLRLADVGDKLTSLRYVTNAAAAMPTSFIPRLQQMIPQAEIFLMHGQTECLRTSYLPPSEIGNRPTSVGRGMPNVELWLEDEQGNRPAPGEVGEMMVRGPGVMVGYWNDPVETAKVIRVDPRTGDRVLRTRDLFRTDEDGYFYFVARTDDIIKSRGQKVSPHEIEQLLFAHDAVLEARVIGVPDPVLGEAICAEIVKVDGAELGDLDVKRYLRTRLEDYKLPQIVRFVDALAKSTSGKILRR